VPNLDSYQFSLYAIPNILVSTTIFLVGVFVFAQNPGHAVNISFFLFCLSLNFWLYGRAVMYCSRDSETALAWAKVFAKFGVVNIAPLVFNFSVHWLGLYQKQKKYVWLGFASAALFYGIILITPYGLTGVRKYFWGYYPVYGPVAMLFLIFFFTYFIAAFVNFFKALKAAEDPAWRKQIKIVTVAYLISFTGSIDFLPKVINFPLYPCGYLSVFLWTMILAYAIVRYRVMDIRTVIHKTLMWLLSSAVALSPFAAATYFGRDWLSGLSTIAFTVTAMIFAHVFCAFFYVVHPLLDQLFRRRHANLQAALARFSSELAHLMSLRDLLQGFTRMIRRTLYSGQVSVYLRDQENEREFIPAIAKRIRGLKRMSAAHPFLIWLEQNNRVVIGDLLASDPKVAEIKNDVADYFEQTQALVAVPFVHGDKLIGVAHLGKKDGVLRYTSEEMDFLTRLMAPVTIAFSNSLHFIRMQESLEKFNVELERKVEERTLQLQETQAQLVQAEKLATIGTLAGGVAHEINNPLTAVLTNAQLLKMTTTNEEDLDSVSLIEEGAKRCQVIIHKLMKYARKPMGTETVERVDLNRVVDSTTALLKYQMAQENIEIDLVKEPEMPFVVGNANELEQVLTNLILNAKDAIKAADRQKGMIRISTCVHEESLCMKVEDNGIGIPKENLPKIFDPFYTTKELGKGTGLGLAVSFGIVQKLGGVMEVNSVVDEGTLFTIKIKRT